MQIRNYPCRGCSGRFIGCHATCNRYQDEHKADMERNEQNFNGFYRYNGIDMYNKRCTRMQKSGWHRKTSF